MQEENNDAQLILDFFASEFSPRFDNNYFFQIVDCIPRKQRNLILETYFNNTFNDSATIDISDPITFTTMKLNKQHMFLTNNRNFYYFLCLDGKVSEKRVTG